MVKEISKNDQLKADNEAKSLKLNNKHKNQSQLSKCYICNRKGTADNLVLFN